MQQVKKSFHQMKGDVGIHNAKSHTNQSLHSKMIVQSCITPPYIVHVRGLRMSSCYEDTYYHEFSHCAYLHHPLFDEMIYSKNERIVVYTLSSFKIKGCCCDAQVHKGGNNLINIILVPMQ